MRAYGAPGNYRSGAWLVKNDKGQAEVVGRSRLPKPGTGWQYYYLGSNESTAELRLPDAISKLDVNTDIVGQNLGRPVQSAFSGKTGTLTKAPSGILGGLSRALRGGSFVTGPLGGAGAAVGGAAVGTTALAGGALGSGSSPFGFNFGAVTDFLNYAAWLLHPLNWLRLAEFTVGLMLSAYGITRLAQRGGASRNPVTGMARRVVSITPAGREIRTLQGRRMGRHEGQREAARMEARQRETRQVRTQSAYERERTNRSARQAARDE